MNMPIQQSSPLSRTRATPFADLEDFFRGFGFRRPWREAETAPDIRLDVGEDLASYRIRAEIPGVEKNDITLSIDGNQVTISADVKRETRREDEKELHVERSYGRALRVFTLPVDVDASKAEATYARGVLSITLPKSADGQSHRIAIT